MHHRRGTRTAALALFLVASVSCGGGGTDASGPSDDASPPPASATTAPYSPPPLEDLGEKRSILRILAKDGRFDILTQILVERTVFARDVMAGPECCLTVFAPVDDAFLALPEAELQAIIEDPEKLTPLIQRHILRSPVKSGELETRVYTTTGQGQEVSVEVGGGAISINNATIIDADIDASNGVIHAIDAVIMLEEDAG